MGSGLSIWDDILSSHLISSLLDIVYFFPIILTAFFKKPAEDISIWRRKDEGGTTVGGHPLDNNGNFLPNIFHISKYVLYI